MSGPQASVLRKVSKEIGRRGMKLMVRKSGSRLLGHLQRNSRVWRKAFEHIKLHFKQVPGKSSHTLFAPKYRTEAAVRELVRKAASKPSHAPVITKQTVAGLPEGTPCVIIDRVFKHAIGTTADGLPAHTLRVVVDFTGKPVTAFPMRAAGNKTFKQTATTVAAVLAPSFMLADLEEAYTAEADARDDREGNLCGPNNLIDWVIEILVSPSCSAEPPSRAFVQQRYEDLVKQVEVRRGTPLDGYTKQSIRADIYALWGWGTIE